MPPHAEVDFLIKLFNIDLLPIIGADWRCDKSRLQPKVSPRIVWVNLSPLLEVSPSTIFSMNYSHLRDQYI